jgi:GNAT superfamily N-acetyltransferase
MRCDRSYKIFITGTKDMDNQAQNSPSTNLSFDASNNNQTVNFFQLAHIYLYYQMLHLYLQFKLKETQNDQLINDNNNSLPFSDNSSFEDSLYRAAMSGFGQLHNLSIPGKFLFQSSNFNSQPPQRNVQNKYEFTVLEEANTCAYKELLDPMFHQYLGKLRVRFPKLIIVGVQFQSQAIGYILTVCLPDKSKACILSFFVDSAHRGQGIGKKLLAKTEQVLKRYGCQQLHLGYSSNTTTPALQHILAKNNWMPSHPYTLICSTLIEDLKKADWLNRYSLPESVTLFLWSELTPEEKERIKQQREDVLKYPPELDPFYDEQILEPITSVGIRYQGEVVGWMITHRIAPDTIRYSALFARKDLPKVRCVLPLMAAAIKRHTEHPEIPNVKYIVMSYNAPMLQFVERHMVPFKTSTNQTWIATKFFNLPPVNPYVSKAVAFN